MALPFAGVALNVLGWAFFPCRMCIFAAACALVPASVGGRFRFASDSLLLAAPKSPVAATAVLNSFETGRFCSFEHTLLFVDGFVLAYGLFRLLESELCVCLKSLR